MYVVYSVALDIVSSDERMQLFTVIPLGTWYNAAVSVKCHLCKAFTEHCIWSRAFSDPAQEAPGATGA